MGKLTDARVRNAKPSDKAYKLSDGEGLYLLVKPSGTKLWRYKYRIAGRERTYSIGPYRDYGLAAARDAHREARNLVRKGIDPTQNRRLEKIRLEQAHAN
ncbi:MAG TPA: Arm DNA-binding domain-containing protein, partial [Gammaproteobacteria bacterium]|nr:Arm DNA-binding domain-containing protein [Gammaproteobacteria bacterium]